MPAEKKNFKVRIVQQFYPPPTAPGQPPQPPRAPEQKAIVDLPWQHTVDGRGAAAKKEVLKRYPGSLVSTSHSENNSVVASFRYPPRPST